MIRVICGIGMLPVKHRRPGELKTVGSIRERFKGALHIQPDYSAFVNGKPADDSQDVSAGSDVEFALVFEKGVRS